MSKTSETDAQLMKKVADGDREAFGLLYDRYVGLVHGVAMKVVREEAIAEDITQEVFLRVWKRPQLYRAEKGALATWLGTISRNRSLDYIRQNSHASQTQEEAPDALSQSTEEELAEHLLLTDHLNALRPEYRQVLALAYYGDLTQKEIAARMNVPLGTVKSWTIAAMKQLTEMYNEKR